MNKKLLQQIADNNMDAQLRRAAQIILDEFYNEEEE